MATATCATCDKEVEVEPVEDGEAGAVMCLECGEEFVPANSAAAKYNGFKVGKVLSSDELKGGLKKLKVDIGGGEEAAVQVVTNAKHVTTGSLVVVATIGAVVPAGAVVGEDPDAVEVAKASVGGTKSEGMICDSPMLGWVGGAKGVVQQLPDTFSPGDAPPAERPRK